MTVIDNYKEFEEKANMVGVYIDLSFNCNYRGCNKRKLESH